MLDFVMNNLDIMSVVKYLVEDSSCSILPTDLQSLLEEVFMWIKIAVPCIVIILCSIDLAKAVISQNDKSMQSALSNCVKRVCIGVAIFFMPSLIDFLLDIGGLISGVCHIGIGE